MAADLARQTFVLMALAGLVITEAIGLVMVRGQDGGLVMNIAMARGQVGGLVMRNHSIKGMVENKIVK
jgi:hypothetical protein